MRTFLFFKQDAKQYDADQSAGGSSIGSIFLCTFVPLYSLYFVLYCYAYSYSLSMYILLYIIRIVRVRPCRLFRLLVVVHLVFLKNMGCLYFLESFLNFQSSCEIGFSISSFYRKLFVFFYFKTTFHHTDSDGLV